MVEVALLLLPFFIFVFMIIDISVVMFDQQLLNHAARYAARQGTLYWVDPDPALDPLRIVDPVKTIRVKEEMIDSAVNRFNNLLIRTGSATVQKNEIDLLGGTLAEDSPEDSPHRVWWEVSDAEVVVRLEYSYGFIAFNKNLLKFIGMNESYKMDMDSDVHMNTESDL
jgi:hypothetical protein